MSAGKTTLMAAADGAGVTELSARARADRVAAALSATETITAGQEEAGSLRTLVPRYLHAAHQHAGNRYRDAAAEAFGPDAPALTGDPAWGAVVRRLYDAEASGWDPVRLLATSRDMRELDSADSVAEVMSWRIDGILSSALSPSAEKTDAGQEPSSVRDNAVLPWLAGPPAAPSGDSGLPEYLASAEAAIGARVASLADRALCERPAWLSMLGPEPADAGGREEWLRHLAVIGAFRDQHQVTADDPRQVLGPYAPAGHAGHTAYWHAASSVLAARRLAGLDAGTAGAIGQRPADPVTAQAAADVYRSLPEPERAEIATAIAARAGVLWLGDRTSPDEDAAAQAAYAGYLTAELTARKHLRPARALQRRRAEEPVEAAYARRVRPRSEAPAPQRRAAAPVTAPRQQPELVPPQETWQRQSGPTPGR
jgi:hypothetical protein